jgi:hypothetical protein
MQDATKNGRETGTSSESSILAESFTAAALLRSIALSLMDTADRIAEWLGPQQPDDDGHDRT